MQAKKKKKKKMKQIVKSRLYPSPTQYGPIKILFKSINDKTVEDNAS